MKRSSVILKRPVYVALLWVFVVAFLAAALPQAGWLGKFKASYSNVDGRWLPVSKALPQITKIRDKALEKGQLTASEYAAAVWQIRDLEDRAGKHFHDSVTGVPKLLGMTMVRASGGGNSLAIALSEEQAKHPGSPAGKNLLLCSLLVGCWFIPFAFLILTMRLATVARTAKQLRAMVRANVWEFVGASLFWGIGLGAFHPEKDEYLFAKIAKLGYREEDDAATDWEAKRAHVLEIIHRGRFDAVSPLQTIWVMLKLVWGGNWRSAGLGVRLAYAKQAIYVSLVGTLMVMAGQMKAYASGDNIVLQRVSISYNRNLSLGGPASENLFLTFKGGVNAGIFGYSSPHPVYELSVDATRLKLLNGSLTLGPFADWSDTGRLTSFGAAGFAVMKLDKATLTTPAYFTRNPKGKHGFSAPNIQLAWPSGKNISYGLGGAVFASEGGKPTYIAGLLLKVKGKSTTLGIRLGQFLSGPSKGQNQLRLDLSFAP